MTSHQPPGMSTKDREATQRDLAEVEALVKDWIENRRDAGWMDKHLSADFRFSTFLLPRIVERDEFLRIVSSTPAELSVVSVDADAVGSIIVTRLLLDVIEEDFTANMGPGMPGADEIKQKIVGRRLAYTSAFRREGGGWRCYDHHQIGPVD